MLLLLLLPLLLTCHATAAATTLDATSTLVVTAAAVLEEAALGTAPSGWDVAIGRRPYIAEDEGSLLLQLGPTALGKALTVTADLPCANATFNWTITTNGTEQFILPFSLSALPQLLNNDMTITVAGAATGSRRRRFQRAFKANSTNTAQVDHSTRGLLVDGEPWALMGWYIYPAVDWQPKTGPCANKDVRARPLECIRWGIGNMTAGMAAMGDRGITAIMPYNFDPYEHDGIGGLPLPELEALVLKYYDAAHAHGVKILHHMAGQGLDKNGYTNVSLSMIERNVALVKDHPALLAYYLCDDCGPGEDMAAAYNTIRQLDPYHLTVGAGFAGNKAQYTDAQINANGQHKLDSLPMLPPITCTKAQGAADPKPCESRFPAACDRNKNPAGSGKATRLLCRFILKGSFYQDWLGTNIGKALKKDAFLQAAALPAAGLRRYFP
jgi:hypothetical protein